MQVLEGHTHRVYCVAVLSDGRVVSGSVDNTERIWDLSTGECVLTVFTNHISRADMQFLPSIHCVLNSFGLLHVSSYCELPPSSGLAGTVLALGTKSGEMHFFSSQKSMEELLNS